MSGTYDFITNSCIQTFANGLTLENDTLVEEISDQYWEEHSDDLMNILAKRADHWAARDLQKYEDYMNVGSRNSKAFDVISAHVPIKGFDRRNEPGYPVDGVPCQTVSPSDVFPTPHYVKTLYAPPIGPPVFGGIDWKPNARPPPPFVKPSSMHLQKKVPHPSGSQSSAALEVNKSKIPAPSRSPQNPLYAKRINLDIVLARKQRNMKLKTRRIQKALLKSPRSKASKTKALATRTHPPRFIVGSPTRSPPRGRTTYKKNIQKNGLKVHRSDMSYLLEADVAMEDDVTGSEALRGSEEDGESEVEYDDGDGEEEEDNVEQDEADERVLESIYHDVSDIKPWGTPRTEDHIVIENIRAIAKKYWHVIKDQDEECRLRCSRTRINRNGRVPCLVPGCAHKSTNFATQAKHLNTHFPPSVFCPVCLCTMTRASSLPRHADGSKDGLCKRILEEKYMLNGNGKKKLYQWFNLYFLGLRDDVEMSDAAFRLIAKRDRNDPLYT